nr:hypothetical protein [Longispora sp. (in: high G+C Gram-positive bacteria)]
LPALGAGAVLLTQRVHTGHWDAFMLIQKGYGNGIRPPWATLRERGSFLRHAPYWPPSEHFWVGRHLHGLCLTVTSVIVVLAVSAVLLRLIRRQPVTHFDIGLSCYALLFWLFPMTIGGGGLSLWRSHLVVLPAAILLRYVPAWLTIPILFGTAYMNFGLAMLFFRGHLV